METYAFLSVIYENINVSDIADFHKYLMQKYNIV